MEVENQLFPSPQDVNYMFTKTQFSEVLHPVTSIWRNTAMMNAGGAVGKEFSVILKSYPSRSDHLKTVTVMLKKAVFDRA